MKLNTGPEFKDTEVSVMIDKMLTEAEKTLAALRKHNQSATLDRQQIFATTIIALTDVPLELVYAVVAAAALEKDPQ